MLSHKSHLHLLNAFPENFKRYFSISYYAYDIPHCDLTPPLGLWYELESTHLLEDASTHQFGFFGHLVFEKKIIVILYIFFIYNYVKIHFPIVVPPNPQGPWFEQSWFYTTWGCLLTSSRFSGFWEDCSRFSVYMYILIMSRGDNEDELYVMMIIILHGNYFNATVKRFGGDNF